MVEPVPDMTGTLSALRARWGSGIVRPASVMLEGGRRRTGTPRPTQDAQVVASHGALALAPLPDLERAAATADRAEGHTSTGFQALDGLIGGLPQQGTVTFLGSPSSGTTTLALRTVAEAQVAGAIVAWLDLPGRFDPLEAAERGVDLRWLVVVRPILPKDGLRIVGTLLASRSIDLLVLDLPSRMPEDQAGLVRMLAAQARRVDGRVLAIGSGSLTPVIRDALAASSHLRLALRHRDWLRVGREVVGQRVTVTVEKDRAGAPGRATDIEIRYQPDGERSAAIQRLLEQGAGPPGLLKPGPPSPVAPPGPPFTHPVPSHTIDRHPDALSPSPLEPSAAPARGPGAIAAIRPGRAGRSAVGSRERP